MEIVNLSKEEKNEYVNSLYKYFNKPYEFEEFLKPFLEAYGYDEVTVTKKSRDGGIDLYAKKLGNFDNDSDVVKIQAKLYQPGSTIGRNVIDELLGVMLSGEKGLVITTGKFSKEAIEATTRKKENPIDLIDGEKLIDCCIDKKIGFVFKPIFSKDEMNNYLTRNVDIPVNFEITENNIIRIKKQITANDIRAKIIGIPNEIYNKLSDDKKVFDISINNEIVKDAKINRERKYFSKGLSSIYSKLGLVTKDNVIKPCVSYWHMEEDNIYIEIESEQD